MKSFAHVSAGVCLFLLTIAAVSVGSNGPKQITIQGFLTDDNGLAVKDSTYTTSSGLWAQIVGGSSLNDAEIHVVTTKNGVFTVELNESGHFFDSCAPCDAWLEIQVLGPNGFEALSPRTHLTAVPHALTSATFHSETSSGSTLARGTVKVINSPGMPLGHELELSTDADGDGTPEFAALDSATTQGVRRLAVADVDGDGVADRSVDIHVNDDRSLLGLKNYDPALGYIAGDMTLQTDSGGSSIDLKAQGSSEALISVHGGSSSMKYKTYQPGQPIYGNLSMEATDSGSVLDLTHVDPTGESGMRAKNIRKNISVNLFKSDKTHAARMALDSGVSELVLEADPEGDDIIEGTAFIQATSSAVKTVILTHMGLGDVHVMDSVDDDGAHTSAQATSTGGGCTMQSDVGYSSADFWVHRTTPDPGNNNHVTQKVSMETLPDTARLSVTAAEVPGNHRDGWNVVCVDGHTVMRSSRTEPDPLGALQVTQEATMETHNDTARMSVSATDVPGNHRDGWNVICVDAHTLMQSFYEAGSDQSHIRDSVDADGAHMEAKAQSTGSTCDLQCDVGYHQAGMTISHSEPDPLGAMQTTAEVSIETRNDTAKVEAKAGGRSSIMRCSDASCRLVMVDGTLGVDDTGLVLDGTGEGKIGLGVSDPTEPIEHSSGAHLTAGGVWTNASDAALKENFQPVDGEDLLERIDRLPIARWNYRNEADEIQHIGPTAQDFKSLFGVGRNNRSISTVDPSGIALAAIKELHKENHELRQQNLELLSRLEELDRKLDRVLSR